jgi:hypothetical protein
MIALETASSIPTEMVFATSWRFLDARIPPTLVLMPMQQKTMVLAWSEVAHCQPPATSMQMLITSW